MAQRYNHRLVVIQREEVVGEQNWVAAEGAVLPRSGVAAAMLTVLELREWSVLVPVPVELDSHSTVDRVQHSSRNLPRLRRGQRHRNTARIALHSLLWQLMGYLRLGEQGY